MYFCHATTPYKLFFSECPTYALFSSDRISFICLHQEQMSTSSCCFPSRLMGGSAGAKAAATRRGKITMATQVICILHVFPSSHPTAYLSHPNLKPIEPVTSWQDGDCSSVSCTQRVWLCFGAHHCRLKSSKREILERDNLQKAELSTTVDGALDMLPLLQSCRSIDAAPGFGSGL